MSSITQYLSEQNVFQTEVKEENETCRISPIQLCLLKQCTVPDFVRSVYIF